MFDLFKRSPQAEHDFCQENLSPFLDAQLTSRERDRVERHLQRCSDCRADLESLRQTVSLLQALPVIKPPRSFYIPAGAGVRQRQMQRTRVAYGYLQFATAVAGALLVLVVSGDALLRMGAASPARQVQEPAVETTAFGQGGDVSTPEGMLTAPSAMLAAPPPASGLDAQESPEPTMAAELSQPVSAPEADRTTAAQEPTDEELLAAKAAPSQTFARAAGAPPMPTATPQSNVVTPPLAEPVQPSPTSVPEALPVAESLTDTTPPTETHVSAADLPSPQPVAGQAERHEPPPQAAGPRASLEAMQPLLPWFELVLAMVIALGLATMLWLRRRQHWV